MKKLLVLVTFFGATIMGFADDSVSTINYHLELECPPSAERDTLEMSIPLPDYTSQNVEEWIQTTVQELEHLIALVRSGNFKNANVEFSSNNPALKREVEGLSSITFSLHAHCIDCSELQDLEDIQWGNENQSYSKWSKNTIDVLHLLQMLILKKKITAIPSQEFEEERTGDFESKDLTCIVCVKGPKSDEFQAVLDAIAQNDTEFTEYDKWSIPMIHTIHTLETLIMSGNINEADCSINVKDL